MKSNKPQVNCAAAPEIGQTVYRKNPYSWTHSKVSVAQSKNAAATVMTYRNNPYDNTNSKVVLVQPTSNADTGPTALIFDVTNSTIPLLEGLVPYAAESEPAAPFDGPTETSQPCCSCDRTGHLQLFKVSVAQPTSDAGTAPMTLTFVLTNCTIVLSEGLVLYAAKSEPAAPYDGPTETIVVGCVPHWMKAALVRWMVQHVTGVAPISLRDGRSGSDRRPSGLFFLKVRRDDVDHILSRSGRALCLQSALWAPQDGMYDVEKVAAELKAHGHVRTMALKFEKMKANAL
jgi:hypothetical protein